MMFQNFTILPHNSFCCESSCCDTRRVYTSQLWQCTDLTKSVLIINVMKSSKLKKLSQHTSATSIASYCCSRFHYTITSAEYSYLWYMLDSRAVIYQVIVYQPLKGFSVLATVISRVTGRSSFPSWKTLDKISRALHLFKTTVNWLWISQPSVMFKMNSFSLSLPLNLLYAYQG